MGALTGSTARRQYNLAAAAQRKQEALQAEEERKLDAIEAGQAKIRNSGGRGLLAYIEDDEQRGAKTLGTSATPAAAKRTRFRSLAEAAGA